MRRSATTAGMAAVLCLLAAGCKSGGPTASSIAAPPSVSLPAVSLPAVSLPAVSLPAAATSAAAPVTGKTDKSHPCGLVTPAEAQAALGVAASITTNNVDDGLYTDCVYTSADAMHILQVSIFDDSDPKSAFDRNVNQLTPESGIGGGALWSPDMALLSVWQNSVLVNFQLNDDTNTMSDAQVLAALETVAKAGIAGL